VAFVVLQLHPWSAKVETTAPLPGADRTPSAEQDWKMVSEPIRCPWYVYSRNDTAQLNRHFR